MLKIALLLIYCSLTFLITIFLTVLKNSVRISHQINSNKIIYEVILIIM